MHDYFTLSARICLCFVFTQIAWACLDFYLALLFSCRSTYLFSMLHYLIISSRWIFTSGLIFLYFVNIMTSLCKNSFFFCFHTIFIGLGVPLGCLQTISSTQSMSFCSLCSVSSVNINRNVSRFVTYKYSTKTLCFQTCFQTCVFTSCRRPKQTISLLVTK